MPRTEATLSSRQKVILQLERLIARELRPGDRLPPVRELIQRYGASPVTVSAALRNLAQSGTLVVRPGAGTFVARPPANPAAPLPAARPGTDVVW